MIKSGGIGFKKLLRRKEFGSGFEVGKRMEENIDSRLDPEVHTI